MTLLPRKRLITYHTVENVKPTFSLFYDNFPHFRTRSLCVNELVAIFPKFLATLRCNFVLFSIHVILDSLLHSYVVYVCITYCAQQAFPSSYLQVLVRHYSVCKYFFDFSHYLFSRLWDWFIFFQILYFSSQFYFLSHMHCRFCSTALLYHPRTLLRGVQIFFWATVLWYSTGFFKWQVWYHSVDIYIYFFFFFKEKNRSDWTVIGIHRRKAVGRR